MDYLLNCWYMAAWSDEIHSGKLLARTLLDQPVVLYRDIRGTIAALYDRCPHRFAPLSRGSVVEEGLACRYHGLRFEAGGACARNPHGAITRALSVRSYPVLEAYKAIWIWMGEPSRANPAMLRNLEFLETAPPSAFSKGYVLGKADYRLFVDNILDLTHADFLHPDTLGGGALTRTQAQILEDRDIVTARWDCLNEVPAPLAARRLGPGVERADSWTEVCWSAPGIMSLASGTVPAGAVTNSNGVTRNVHIMTPETAATTHYFYAATRSFAQDDETLNAAIKTVRDRIFTDEDEPMIRGQQERIGDAEFESLRPALLRIDEGAVRVRRVLERLITAEHAQALDAAN